MVETVKFNVGGRHFEVSRDLIDSHPDTMLAKLTSEAWEKDPDTPVFIDRDGDKFSLVLDYLRYGSIELPAATPYSMFQRELDYYGIVETNGSVIKRKTLAELISEISEQKLNHDIFNLAAECYNQFYLGTSASKFRSGTDAIRFCLKQDKTTLSCSNNLEYRIFGPTFLQP